MKMVKGIFCLIFGFVVFYIAGALTLIFWPEPDYFAEHPLSSTQYQALQKHSGVSYSTNTPFLETVFEARDGTSIYARRYKPSLQLNEQAETTIVYLHGVASKSAYLNKSAGLLMEATGASVITPDLRGHANSEGAAFDVSHIGQYEEDIVDLIQALRLGNSDLRILIAGHSMGGGIALRYALLEDAPEVSGYLLLAPNMGPGPTQPNPADTPPEVAEFASAFVNFNTKRFIGTIMMNIIGVQSFDHKPIMYFNAPPEMPRYSYAAIASAQPNAPQGASIALNAMTEPLLVIVGANDEAFVASEYEGLISANSDGETIVIDNLNHNQILNSTEIVSIISDWYAKEF